MMFYERYLLLCQGANQSPSSVAINAGFSKGTVSVWKKKYEQSVDVRPEPDVIDKICTYFNCTEAWLLGIDDKEKTPAPVGERNIIRLVGRDGSVIEKVLTDEQLSAYKTMVDHLPEADDL